MWLSLQDGDEHAGAGASVEAGHVGDGWEHGSAEGRGRWVCDNGGEASAVAHSVGRTVSDGWGALDFERADI